MPTAPPEPIAPPEPGRVVLVTGAGQGLGARLSARLAASPGIERVIGLDAGLPPAGRGYGGAEFLRADIRHPVLGRVVADAEVDTVVHLGVVPAAGSPAARTAAKEVNVVGTMQLLAACQKAPSVRRLVLRSTAAVYGRSPRNPAVFAEDTEPRSAPRSGYARDAVEVEGYVRGFARRRPDVAVTVLRFAAVIGPEADTPLARYFAAPVVPTMLGFDPRVQLLHSDDALDALTAAVTGDQPGSAVINVAGQGVLALSQAVRRAGRVPVPVPTTTGAGTLGWAVRRLGAGRGPEQLGDVEFDCVLDTTRLRSELRFTPRYTTRAAFEDYLRRRPAVAGA